MIESFDYLDYTQKHKSFKTFYYFFSGHGNLTPRTSEGKIVTMVYALVGVPLMLMCLSSLGGLLADALQCTYGKLCGTKNKHLPVNTHEGCQQFEEVNICLFTWMQLLT